MISERLLIAVVHAYALRHSSAKLASVLHAAGVYS